VRELESLTDDSRQFLVIDTASFPNANEWPHWSSSTYSSSPDLALDVYFNDGLPGRVYFKDDARNVRCVRGGNGSFGGNLTITKDGSGTGSVTADSGTISWSGNSVTAGYFYNTQVTLSPNPDASSIFDGWSGAGCSGTGSCTVTMEDDITVNATFNLNPARIAGPTPDYFTTLKGAYDGAGS